MWHRSKFGLLRFWTDIKLISLHLAPSLFALRSRRRRPPPVTLVHSPDSTTDRSPSLLPRLQRFPQEASTSTAKRKKEESEPEGQEDVKRGKRQDESRQGFKEPLDKKVRPEEVCRVGGSFPDQSCKSMGCCTVVFFSPVQSAQRRFDVSRASPTLSKASACEDGRRARHQQELHDSCERLKGNESECSSLS